MYGSETQHADGRVVSGLAEQVDVEADPDERGQDGENNEDGKNPKEDGVKPAHRRMVSA